jgi:hypothetical protein
MTGLCAIEGCMADGDFFRGGFPTCRVCHKVYCRAHMVSDSIEAEWPSRLPKKDQPQHQPQWVGVCQTWAKGPVFSD